MKDVQAKLDLLKGVLDECVAQVDAGNIEHAFARLTDAYDPRFPIFGWFHLVGLCLTRMKLVNPAASAFSRELELFPSNTRAQSYLSELLATFQFGPRHEVEFESIIPNLIANTVLIDIGSNVGNVAFEFLTRNIRVISIEAFRRNVEYQSLRFMGHDRCNVLHGACSSSEGLKKLWVGDDCYATFSTLESGWVRACHKEYNLGLSEEVPCGTVWDFLDLVEPIEGQPLFVKVDVCGHEGEVLRGLFGDRRSAQVEGIMIECLGLLDTEARVKEITATLVREGFHSLRYVFYHGRLVMRDSGWLTDEDAGRAPFPLLSNISAGGPLEHIITSIIGFRRNPKELAQ